MSFVFGVAPIRWLLIDVMVYAEEDCEPVGLFTALLVSASVVLLLQFHILIGLHVISQSVQNFCFEAGRFEFTVKY